MELIRPPRTARVIPFLIVVCFCLLPAQAQYSGGTGEPNDPYQIATAADLIALGETPDDYDKHFILTADIDLDPNLPGRKVFDRAVIAPDVNEVEGWFQGTAFSGVFEGNNHLISHLTVAGGSDLGLFGWLDSSALVSGLGLTAVAVEGTGSCIGAVAGVNEGTIASCSSIGQVAGLSAVGGLTGQNEGSIIGSYHAGVVSGDLSRYTRVGGLVGTNYGGIVRSGSTATVTGYDNVGGLVGYNEGSIVASYNTGMVSGTTGFGFGSPAVGGVVGANGGNIVASYNTGPVSGDRNIGGLAGSSSGPGSIAASYSTGVVTGGANVGGVAGANFGTLSACFWDIETSGQLNMCGTQDDSWSTDCDDTCGFTTAEMQTASTFLDAGWDFIGETVNGICDYWQILPGHYPCLCSETGEGPAMLQGSGSPEDPYLIRDARDLGTVWFEPIAHYRLEGSIDLSGITWSMAVVPFFGGAFDGNGLVITNLQINGGSYLGLVGALGTGATISDLGVEPVDVNGTGLYIGGLAGRNGPIGDRTASLANCRASGAVNGEEYVGGLVGCNCADIVACKSAGTVTGSVNMGGLVGCNYGNVRTSSSTCSATGSLHIGGLVGYNSSSIDGSQSAGTVDGEDDVGGLVGCNGEGIVTKCSSTSIVEGDRNVGGLVGRNAESYGHMGVIAESYSVGAVGGYNGVGGLVGRNSGSVATSWSAGAVTGDWHVGGIVGQNGDVSDADDDVLAVLRNCYNTGPVTGGKRVGGVVGTNVGHISTTYSTGSVSGNVDVGGLVGPGGIQVVSKTVFGDATASFWDIQTSGQTTSAGGTGKTTAEMQVARTFLEAGWDFIDETANGTDDIWWILEGQGYPRLWWELIPEN